MIYFCHCNNNNNNSITQLPRSPGVNSNCERRGSSLIIKIRANTFSNDTSSQTDTRVVHPKKE